MKKFFATLGTDGVPEGAQGKLAGQKNQFVGFNESGDAEAQSLPVTIIAGTYVGEIPYEYTPSPIKKIIDLGARPKAVLIVSGGSANFTDLNGDRLWGGLCLDGHPVMWTMGSNREPKAAISVEENGFSVTGWYSNNSRFDSSLVNQEGSTYHYLAFL